MGFGINATVISGGIIGGAFAVDADLGAAALGGVGTLYACAMSTYGVFGVMGMAASAFRSDDEDEKPASTSQQITGKMHQIAASSDAEMQKFQEIARISGRFGSRND